MFIEALWSPAGKGLSSWFSFVMYNCEVALFTLVCWVRCGLFFCLFGSQRRINPCGSLASDGIKLNMMKIEKVKKYKMKYKER